MIDIFLVLSGIMISIFSLVVYMIHMKEKNQVLDFTVKTPFLYDCSPYFLNQSEQSFFHCLKEALREDYYIFPKVRLEDIVKPQKGLTKTEKRQVEKNIRNVLLDYVICDMETMMIKYVILFDTKKKDISKNHPQKTFLESLLNPLEIDSIFLSSKEKYSVVFLKEIFFSNLPR